MTTFVFAWDDRKAAANLRKHGVAFDEAASVFYDEEALLLADPDHSEAEDRFVLIGLSARLHLLVVVHCYPDADGSVVRLISARTAARSEQHHYVERCRHAN